MRRTSIYKYYAFGYNYRVLRNESLGMQVHGDDNSLEKRIDYFFSKLKELNLEVTLAVASDLLKLHEEIKALDKDALVSEALATRVSRAIDILDPSLDAELQLRVSYLLTPKRFHLPYLLETPAALFGKDVFDKLTLQARMDVVNGFRCIATGQPTAAAFHLLRATEEMIRQLYLAVILRKRLKILMWNPMVEALRNKKKGCPKIELLDHLDTIRKNYRNPTQHPDKFYDLDEAQDLASNCISAINLIVAEIKRCSSE